jgi:hypothetical protein
MLLLKKNASQSSTFSIAPPYDYWGDTVSLLGPQYGVDGNPGSFAHTLSEESPWWQVNLTAPFSNISFLVIHNRRDCCEERLSSATIFLSDGNLLPIANVTLPVTPVPKYSIGYCLTCPASYYCPSFTTTTPLVCPPGHFCPQGTTYPIPCPADTYSGYAATFCMDCSSGASCTGDLWSTGVELTEDELFDAHWRFSKGGDNSAISSSAFSPAPISYSYVDWISVADTNGRWTGVSDAEPGWYTFTTPFYSPVGFTLTGNFSVDDHPGSLIVSPSSDSALLDQTVTWDHLGVFTFTSMSPSSSISFTVENTGGALGLFVSFTSLTLHCPAGSFSSVISTEPLQATCEPCAAGKYSSAGATSCTNFDAILWNTCSSLRYIRITAVSILNFGELEVINFTGSNVAFKKNASQSSTFSIAPPYDYWGDTVSLLGPQYGVDGNPGSFAHTLSEESPWWQVDLTAPFSNISFLVIHNRRDCCEERLSSATIFLSDGNLLPIANVTLPVTPVPKYSIGYCLTCPASYYCPSFTTTTPLVCPPGHFCPQGTTYPIPCPADTYSGYAATFCMDCSSGASCTGDLWSTGVELTEDELFDAHWRFSKGGDNSAISSSAFSPAPISYSYVDWISVADTNGRWTGVSDAEPGWYTFTTPFYSPVGFTLTGNFSVDDHPGSLIVSPSSDSALLDQTVTWDHLGVFTFTSMSPSSSISFTVENTGGALGLFVSFTSLTLHCPAGSFSSVISTEPLQATCEPCAAGKYSSAGATSCTNFDAILWNTCSSLRYIRITAVSILNFGELEVINFTGSNVAFKKNASQSSTFSIAPPYDYWGDTVSLLGPQYGVDGNPGSFAHTLSEESPWWQVDLTAPFSNISFLVIHNRRDCCEERLSSATIFLSDGNLLPIANVTLPVTPVPKYSIGYCLTCPASYYCPSFTTTTPLVCPPGHFCPQGTTYPIPCPADTYSGYAATFCMDCSSGASCTGDLWSTGVELTEDELFDAHWRFSKGGDNSAISSSAFSPAPISYSYVDWISVADTNGRWTGVSDAEPGWYTFTTPFYSPVGFTLTGNFSVDDHPGSLIVSPSSDSALLDQTVTWDHLGVFTFTSMSPSSSISFTVENTGGALGLFVSFTSLTLHCPAGSFSSVISTEPLQATCEPCAAGKYSSAGATSCTNFDAILWNTCSSLRYIRITAVSILNFGELEVINFTGSNVAFKKNASQSSTFSIAPPYDYWGDTVSLLGPQYGVDGNPGSFAHTLSEESPWWQVDLTAPFSNISFLVIHNRRDCCEERLSSATIFLSDGNLLPIANVTLPVTPVPKYSIGYCLTCPASYYCPSFTTTTPLVCPPGHFCPQG